jgi:hypothetical protein
MIPNRSIRPAFCAVLLLVLPRPAAAALYCSTSRALVSGGDTVAVTGYSDSALQAGTFSSKDGAIRDQPTARNLRSFESRWTLPLLRGTYDITGTATSAAGTAENCRARVVVTGDSLGPGVESGRLFLPASSREQVGYGSYTYLLCPAAAAAPVQARCESALKAIIGALPDIAQYDRVFSKTELNTVYVPVEFLPPASASAAEILKRYDFARARSWLNIVDRTLRDGPYLVTVARPLSPTERQEMILQKLDGVASSVVANWITAYLRELGQQTVYGRGFEPSVTLRMRTILAVVAESVPNISAALSIIH